MRLFFQRRRKLLMRFAALGVVGLGGLVAVLPRADAGEQNPRWTADEAQLLLAPAPFSDGRFALLMAPTQP